MRKMLAALVIAGSFMAGGTAIAQANPPSQPPTPLCLVVGGAIWVVRNSIDPYGLSQEPLAVALRNAHRQVCGG
ncbi:MULTISPECIES: hypothetical protein [Nocardia]|jgi:hypothetical protein|uniref:hypothetical protein n=2 Tax=Nocardiaceae TaxID=85025 RepID=UPI0005BBD122|nr:MULTISPECIES: hypothetical protein [Nocardia]MBF6339466.1 hypothetical protein [Nocardia abscessus]MBF6474775.1 hypothetical protein [Nocardia abscessus]MCC3329058.1 hypothetical protein [Nocardia abscessus]